MHDIPNQLTGQQALQEAQFTNQIQANKLYRHPGILNYTKQIIGWHPNNVTPKWLGKLLRLTPYY